MSKIARIRKLSNTHPNSEPATGIQIPNGSKLRSSPVSHNQAPDQSPAGTAPAPGQEAAKPEPDTSPGRRGGGGGGGCSWDIAFAPWGELFALLKKTATGHQIQRALTYYSSDPYARAAQWQSGGGGVGCARDYTANGKRAMTDSGNTAGPPRATNT